MSNCIRCEGDKCSKGSPKLPGAACADRLLEHFCNDNPHRAIHIEPIKPELWRLIHKAFLEGARSVVGEVNETLDPWIE